MSCVGKLARRAFWTSLPLCFSCQLLMPVDDVVATATTRSSAMTPAAAGEQNAASRSDTAPDHNNDAAADTQDTIDPPIAARDEPRAIPGTPTAGAAGRDDGGADGAPRASDSTMSGGAGGRLSSAEPLAEGCRRFPTKTSFVTLGPSQTATGMTACSFDRSTLTRTCTESLTIKSTTTTNTADPAAAPTTTSSSSTMTWSSLAEVLKHNAPFGKSTHAKVTSQNAGCTYVETMSYDAQGRNTGASGMGCQQQTSETCTEWDDLGRVLRCTSTLIVSGAGAGRGTSTLTYVYDDAARTVAERHVDSGVSAGTGTKSTSYDADGWPTAVRQASDDSGTSVPSTYEYPQTELICP